MHIQIDCMNHLRKIIFNKTTDDTISDDSLDTHIYPLIHTDPSYLNETLHNICQNVSMHIVDPPNLANSSPNLTTNGDTYDIDNLGQEDDVTSNCSASRSNSRISSPLFKQCTIQTI